MNPNFPLKNDTDISSLLGMSLFYICINCCILLRVTRTDDRYERQVEILERHSRQTERTTNIQKWSR
jgi:hypothetical protein